MKHSEEMRRCLVDCDVVQMRKLDQHLMPHLREMSDGEVLITIYITRTFSDFIPFRLRAYSHRWLLDHGYPSKLPDELKPRAERIYPQVIEGVGVAVKSSSKPLADLIRDEMSNAVMDFYADNRSPNPLKVRKRVLEVKDKILHKLLGIK